MTPLTLGTVDNTLNGNTESLSVLVLGSNGKTGSRVLKRLQAGNHNVRPGSRKAQPAFDWDLPSTWDAALQGIQAVYVAYQPDLCVPARSKR